MTAPKDRWLDREAGPVVRPYAVTKGRTRPAGGTSFGLIDLVVASDLPPPPGSRLTSEHHRILERCLYPVTVVDLASDVDLPVGVVRVLLGDLRQDQMIRILATPRGRVTSEHLLKDVLAGLRAL
jgi:hypothetical protein